MSYPTKNPTLFEVFGRSATVAIPDINESALQSLVSILLAGDSDEGKVVLLHSPRAGYGKTLLLQAAKEHTGEAARFFAVEPSGGGRLDGEVVLDSLLRQLAVVLPGSGGLTEFDFVTRKLLALGLKPLLISGEIPSHDREGALFAIENRPIETFDFHHQQAATAHWTQANFEVLGPRLASELSEVSHCGLRESAYWVDLLFRYATTPPERVERTRQLSEAVFADLQGLGTSVAEDRLQSLLCLMSLVHPVVLVFDETEGLSNQPEAGLRVAAFIAQIRQACPGLTVVLSVNEDVWETGIVPLMPGGLRDRLTQFEVSLDALSRTDAKTLLQSRFGDSAELIADRMNWPEPLYSRALLKEGSRVATELMAAGYFADAAPEKSNADSASEPSSMEFAQVMPPPLSEAVTAISKEIEKDAETVSKSSESETVSSEKTVTETPAEKTPATETPTTETPATEPPAAALPAAEIAEPAVGEPASIKSPVSEPPTFEPAVSETAAREPFASEAFAEPALDPSPIKESSPFQFAQVTEPEEKTEVVSAVVTPEPTAEPESKESAPVDERGPLKIEKEIRT